MSESLYWVYVSPAGFHELRQIRYRAQFLAGREHPHDLCAIGRDADELRRMVEQYKLGAVDWNLGR